jgi:hypothetical protein
MAQVVSRQLPTGFDPPSVHVGFVVGKVALGQEFHSTGAPLLGKLKKNYHLHHRVAQ